MTLISDTDIADNRLIKAESVGANMVKDPGLSRAIAKLAFARVLPAN
jgi:hypothetical protein